MSKEAIVGIRDAEAQAQKIIADAAEKAKAMISDAEKKAVHLREQTEKSTSLELERTLYAMRQKADALIEKSLAEARAEADELVAGADMKTLSAVKKIVWEIIDA